jgi:hypothetical protein
MDKAVKISMVLGAVLVVMTMSLIELVATRTAERELSLTEACEALGGRYAWDQCVMPVVVTPNNDDTSRRSWKDRPTSTGGWVSVRSYSGANVESGASSGEATAYGYATVGRPRESQWGSSASIESGASASAHAFGGN